MKRWQSMVLFALCFNLVAFVQTTTGQIDLTLLNARGGPMDAVAARFLSEQGAVIGACMTDGRGTCTILLVAAPADASGFIRGTLVIEGYGNRPLIWPGGPLPLTLRLSETGTVEVPMDILATRGPNSDVVVQPLTDANLAATATTLAQGAATVTAQPVAAATGAALAATPPPSLPTAAPTVAAMDESHAAPPPTASPPSWLLLVALLGVLAGGALLFIILNNRKGRAS